MFEYLIPQLLQQTYDNSLLDKADREAVAVQIACGQDGEDYGVDRANSKNGDARTNFPGQ